MGTPKNYSEQINSPLITPTSKDLARLAKEVEQIESEHDSRLSGLNDAHSDGFKVSFAHTTPQGLILRAMMSEIGCPADMIESPLPARRGIDWQVIFDMIHQKMGCGLARTQIRDGDIFPYLLLRALCGICYDSDSDIPKNLRQQSSLLANALSWRAIYGLHFFGTLFYIGKAKSLIRRVADHLTSATNGGRNGNGLADAKKIKYSARDNFRWVDSPHVKIAKTQLLLSMQIIFLLPPHVDLDFWEGLAKELFLPKMELTPRYRHSSYTPAEIAKTLAFIEQPKIQNIISQSVPRDLNLRGLKERRLIISHLAEDIKTEIRSHKVLEAHQ